MLLALRDLRAQPGRQALRELRVQDLLALLGILDQPEQQEAPARLALREQPEREVTVRPVRQVRPEREAMAQRELPGLQAKQELTVRLGARALPVEQVLQAHREPLGRPERRVQRET